MPPYNYAQSELSYGTVGWANDIRPNEEVVRACFGVVGAFGTVIAFGVIRVRTLRQLVNCVASSVFRAFIFVADCKNQCQGYKI